jgi:hypothetical protein
LYFFFFFSWLCGHHITASVSSTKVAVAVVARDFPRPGVKNLDVGLLARPLCCCFVAWREIRHVCWMATALFLRC